MESSPPPEIHAEYPPSVILESEKSAFMDPPELPQSVSPIVEIQQNDDILTKPIYSRISADEKMAVESLHTEACQTFKSECLTDRQYSELRRVTKIFTLSYDECESKLAANKILGNVVSGLLKFYISKRSAKNENSSDAC